MSRKSVNRGNNSINELADEFIHVRITLEIITLMPYTLRGYSLFHPRRPPSWKSGMTHGRQLWGVYTLFLARRSSSWCRICLVSHDYYSDSKRLAKRDVIRTSTFFLPHFDIQYEIREKKDNYDKKEGVKR